MIRTKSDLATMLIGALSMKMEEKGSLSAALLGRRSFYWRTPSLVDLGEHLADVLVQYRPDLVADSHGDKP